MEGRDAAAAAKSRGMFEIPPRGYTGSLKGTSWDMDVINEPYLAGSGQRFMEGPQ